MYFHLVAIKSPWDRAMALHLNTFESNLPEAALCKGERRSDVGIKGLEKLNLDFSLG